LNYRQLNKLTIKKKYPLPRIEGFMDQLHEASVFLNIDLRSGYHQILVKVEDVHKTTFRSCCGPYEYVLISFGVTNVPSLFMDFMNKIFHLFFQEFVVVFINDILIYSRIEEGHRERLKTMLKIYKEKLLYAKFSKCELWLKEVNFLRHVISVMGISMDPAKLEAVLQWSALRQAQR